MEAQGVKSAFTTSYHPQANRVDRSNKDKKALLRKYCYANQTAWDKYIYEFLFVLRTTLNRAMGFTPAMLNLGRELRSPRECQWTGKKSNFDNIDDLEKKDYVKAKQNVLQQCISFERENNESC